MHLALATRLYHELHALSISYTPLTPRAALPLTPHTALPARRALHTPLAHTALHPPLAPTPSTHLAHTSLAPMAHDLITPSSPHHPIISSPQTSYLGEISPLTSPLISPHTAYLGATLESLWSYTADAVRCLVITPLLHGGRCTLPSYHPSATQRTLHVTTLTRRGLHVTQLSPLSGELHTAHYATPHISSGELLYTTYITR